MNRTVQLKLYSTNLKNVILDNISKNYTDIYNNASIQIHRYTRTNKQLKGYAPILRNNLGSRLWVEATDFAYSSLKSCHNKWIKADKSKTSYPKIPQLKSNTLKVSSCVAEIIQDNENSFPLWIELQNPFSKRNRLLIPAKITKFFNQYQNNGWKLGSSFTLKKINNNWYALLSFEKEAPLIKVEGNKMGIDVGLNKLGTTSEGEILGDKVVVNKKKLTKRDYAMQKNEIGRIVNQIDFKQLNLIAMENIKNIHKNKSNTYSNRKSGFKVKSAIFNKRLSKAMLNYFITLVERRCEENGVQFISVAPYYTSQRCNKCGYIHKSNRQGEKFHCVQCGFSIDADVNGARNILLLALGLWDNQYPRKEVSNKERLV